jgi:hypothetical protein
MLTHLMLLPAHADLLHAAVLLRSHLLEHEDNEMMRPFCVGNPGFTNPHNGQPMCA